MDKVDVRAAKKYFCKEGMSLKENHDFIKTLGDDSLSYSMVKKCTAGFRSGREGECGGL